MYTTPQDAAAQRQRDAEQHRLQQLTQVHHHTPTLEHAHTYTINVHNFAQQHAYSATKCHTKSTHQNRTRMPLQCTSHKFYYKYMHIRANTNKNHTHIHCYIHTHICAETSTSTNLHTPSQLRTLTKTSLRCTRTAAVQCVYCI